MEESSQDKQRDRAAEWKMWDRNPSPDTLEEFYWVLMESRRSRSIPTESTPISRRKWATRMSLNNLPEGRSKEAGQFTLDNLVVRPPSHKLLGGLYGAALQERHYQDWWFLWSKHFFLSYAEIFTLLFIFLDLQGMAKTVRWWIRRYLYDSWTSVQDWSRRYPGFAAFAFIMLTPALQPSLYMDVVWPRGSEPAWKAEELDWLTFQFREAEEMVGQARQIDVWPDRFVIETGETWENHKDQIEPATFARKDLMEGKGREGQDQEGSSTVPFGLHPSGTELASGYPRYQKPYRLRLREPFPLVAPIMEEIRESRFLCESWDEYLDELPRRLEHKRDISVDSSIPKTPLTPPWTSRDWSGVIDVLEESLPEVREYAGDGPTWYPIQQDYQNPRVPIDPSQNDLLSPTEDPSLAAETKATNNLWALMARHEEFLTTFEKTVPSESLVGMVLYKMTESKEQIGRPPSMNHHLVHNDQLALLQELLLRDNQMQRSRMGIAEGPLRWQHHRRCLLKKARLRKISRKTGVSSNFLGGTRWNKFKRKRAKNAREEDHRKKSAVKEQELILKTLPGARLWTNNWTPYLAQRLGLTRVYTPDPFGRPHLKHLSEIRTLKRRKKHLRKVPKRFKTGPGQRFIFPSFWRMSPRQEFGSRYWKRSRLKFANQKKFELRSPFQRLASLPDPAYVKSLLESINDNILLNAMVERPDDFPENFLNEDLAEYLEATNIWEPHPKEVLPDNAEDRCFEALDFEGKPVWDDVKWHEREKQLDVVQHRSYPQSQAMGLHYWVPMNMMSTPLPVPEESILPKRTTREALNNPPVIWMPDEVAQGWEELAANIRMSPGTHVPRSEPILSLWNSTDRNLHNTLLASEVDQLITGKEEDQPATDETTEKRGHWWLDRSQNSSHSLYPWIFQEHTPNRVDGTLTIQPATYKFYGALEEPWKLGRKYPKNMSGHRYPDLESTQVKHLLMQRIRQRMYGGLQRIVRIPWNAFGDLFDPMADTSDTVDRDRYRLGLGDVTDLQKQVGSEFDMTLSARSPAGGHLSTMNRGNQVFDHVMKNPRQNSGLHLNPTVDVTPKEVDKYRSWLVGHSLTSRRLLPDDHQHGIVRTPEETEEKAGALYNLDLPDPALQDAAPGEYRYREADHHSPWLGEEKHFQSRLLYNGLLMPHGMLPRTGRQEYRGNPRYQAMNKWSLPDSLLRGNIPRSAVMRSQLVRELVQVRKDLLEEVVRSSKTKYDERIRSLILDDLLSAAGASSTLGHQIAEGQEITQKDLAPLTPEEIALLEEPEDELSDEELAAQKILQDNTQEHALLASWEDKLAALSDLSDGEENSDAAFAALARVNYILGRLGAIDQYPTFRPLVGISDLVDDQVNMYRQEATALFLRNSARDRKKLLVAYQAMGEEPSSLEQDRFLAQTIDTPKLNARIADHLARIKTVLHPAGWQYLYGWDLAKSQPAADLRIQMKTGRPARKDLYIDESPLIAVPRKEVAATGATFAGENLEEQIVAYLSSYLPAGTFQTYGVPLASYLADHIYREENSVQFLGDARLADHLEALFYKFDHRPNPRTPKPLLEIKRLPGVKVVEKRPVRALRNLDPWFERATPEYFQKDESPATLDQVWWRDTLLRKTNEEIHEIPYPRQLRLGTLAAKLSREKLGPPKVDSVNSDQLVEMPGDPEAPVPPAMQGRNVIDEYLLGITGGVGPEKQEGYQALDNRLFSVKPKDALLKAFLRNWKLVHVNELMNSWTLQTFHPGNLDPVLRERFQTGWTTDRIPKSLWERWRKDRLETLHFYRSGNRRTLGVAIRPEDPSSLATDHQYQSKAGLLTSLLGNPQERLGNQLAYGLVPPQARPPLLVHSITPEEEVVGKPVWVSQALETHDLAMHPDLSPQGADDKTVPVKKKRFNPKALGRNFEYNWQVHDRSEQEDTQRRHWNQRRRRRTPWLEGGSLHMGSSDPQLLAALRAIHSDDEWNDPQHLMIDREILAGTGTRKWAPGKPEASHDPLDPAYALEALMASSGKGYALDVTDLSDETTSVGRGYARPKNPGQALKPQGHEVFEGATARSLRISPLLDLGRYRPSRDVLELPSGWSEDIRAQEIALELQEASQGPARLMVFGDISFQVQEFLAERTLQNIFNQFTFRFGLPLDMEQAVQPLFDTAFLSGDGVLRQNPAVQTARYRVVPNLFFKTNSILPTVESVVLGYLSIHQFAFMSYHIMVWFLQDISLGEMVYLLLSYILRPFKWQIVFRKRAVPQRFRFKVFRPKTKLGDMAGVEDMIEKSWDIMNYLHFSHKIYSVFEINRWIRDEYILPKAMLLGGPPGTGKTFFVQALAGETNVPVLTIEPVDLVAPKLMVVTQRVFALFDLAAEMAPCIIFLDEIELIARQRKGLARTVRGEAWSKWRRSSHSVALEESYHMVTEEDWDYPFAMDHTEPETVDDPSQEEIEERLDREASELARDQANLLLEFIVKVDQLDPYSGVFLIGATNFPENLDGALMRPGRFTRELNFKLPDANARVELLQFFRRTAREASMTSAIDHDDNVAPAFYGPTELSNYIFRTEGLNQADLAVIHNETVLQSFFIYEGRGISNLGIAMDRVQNPKRLMDGTRPDSYANFVKRPVWVLRTCYQQAAKGMLHSMLDGLPPLLWLERIPRAFEYESDELYSPNARWSYGMVENWMIARLIFHVSQLLMNSHTNNFQSEKDNYWYSMTHRETYILDEIPGDTYEEISAAAFFMVSLRGSFSNQVLASRYARYDAVIEEHTYRASELSHLLGKPWRPWRQLWLETDSNDLFEYDIYRDKWDGRELEEEVKAPWILGHWIQFGEFNLSLALDDHLVTTRTGLMTRRNYKRDTWKVRESYLLPEYRRSAGRPNHTNEIYRGFRDTWTSQIITGAFKKTWLLLITNRPLWDYLATTLLLEGRVEGTDLIKRVGLFMNRPEICDEKLDDLFPLWEDVGFPDDPLNFDESEEKNIHSLGNRRKGYGEIIANYRSLELNKIYKEEHRMPLGDLLEDSREKYFAGVVLTDEEETRSAKIWSELQEWNDVTRETEPLLIPFDFTHMYLLAANRTSRNFRSEWRGKTASMRTQMLALQANLPAESGLGPQLKVIFDLLALMDESLLQLGNFDPEEKSIQGPVSSRAGFLFAWPFRMLCLVPNVLESIEMLESLYQEDLDNGGVSFSETPSEYVATRMHRFLDNMPELFQKEWKHDLDVYLTIYSPYNQVVMRHRLNQAIDPLFRVRRPHVPLTTKKLFKEAGAEPDEWFEPQYWQGRNPTDRMLQLVDNNPPVPWTRLTEPFQALEAEALKAGIPRDNWQLSLQDMIDFPVRFDENARMVWLTHVGIMRLHMDGFNLLYRRAHKRYVTKVIPEIDVPEPRLSELSQGVAKKRPDETLEDALKRQSEADFARYRRARGNLQRIQRRDPETTVTLDALMAEELAKIAKYDAIQNAERNLRKAKTAWDPLKWKQLVARFDHARENLDFDKYSYTDESSFLPDQAVKDVEAIDLGDMLIPDPLEQESSRETQEFPTEEEVKQSFPYIGFDGLPFKSRVEVLKNKNADTWKEGRKKPKENP